MNRLPYSTCHFPATYKASYDKVKRYKHTCNIYHISCVRLCRRMFPKELENRHSRNTYKHTHEAARSHGHQPPVSSLAHHRTQCTYYKIRLRVFDRQRVCVCVYVVRARASVMGRAMRKANPYWVVDNASDLPA